MARANPGGAVRLWFFKESATSPNRPLALCLTALLLLASTRAVQGQAGGADSKEPFDEHAASRKKEVKHWEEVAHAPWEDPADYEKAARGTEESAQLIEARHGKGSQQARPIRATADAFAELLRSPVEKRQLYVQAYKLRDAGYAVLARGDRVRGIRQMQQAQEQLEKVLGAGNLLLIYNLFNLTLVEAAVGEYEKGKAHSEELVFIVEREWGRGNGPLAHAIYHLAKNEYGLRDFDAAERHLNEAISLFEFMGKDRTTDWYTQMWVGVEILMARMLNEQSRFADAEPHAQRASGIATFFLREQYGNFLDAQIELARSQSGQGKDAAAEVTFRLLLSAIEKEWPPQIVIKILAPYAEHLRNDNRPGEAERVDARIKVLEEQARGRK